MLLAHTFTTMTAVAGLLLIAAAMAVGRNVLLKKQQEAERVYRQHLQESNGRANAMKEKEAAGANVWDYGNYAYAHTYVTPTPTKTTVVIPIQPTGFDDAICLAHPEVCRNAGLNHTIMPHPPHRHGTGATSNLDKSDHAASDGKNVLLTPGNKVA